jgi:anti-sigma B factor antagonist
MAIEDRRSIDPVEPDAEPVVEPFNVSSFQVFVGHKDDRTHMIVMGDLDLASAPSLAHELLAVTAEHDGDVILDIGLLTFIDSTGLSLFVSQHKRLAAQGHTLTIYGPTASARRLFELSGLTDVLHIENSA